MNEKIIYLLLIVLVLFILIRKVIPTLQNKDDLTATMSSEEYNDILDKIIDLSISRFENGVESFNDEQLAVVSAIDYYNEMMNGGLGQFFINSSRIYTSVLSNSLGEVGALKHKDYFDNYITENAINVDEISSLDEEEYLSKYGELTFNEFDRSFYDLNNTEELCGFIIKYAKNNYDKIFK